MTNTVGFYLLITSLALAAAGCGQKDKKNQEQGKQAEGAAQAGESQATTFKPTEKPIEPTPDPPKLAPLGPCPLASSITELTSSIDISEAGPFDWSKFTVAKALAKDDGKQLRIFLSNQDYPTKKMDGLMTPVAAVGDGVLAISLYNGADKVTIGEYKPGKFKDPFTALAELQVHKGDRGAFVGLGINDGVVRVLDMPDGKICGEFEVKSAKSLAKGTFIATVE